MNLRTKIPPYITLIPICAGVFIAADDQTVVVTILPQVMIDLKVQITTELDRASWIVTGYLVGYLAAMPIIGRLSDTWGHRRLFIVAMAMFMAGSVAVAVPKLSLDIGLVNLTYTNTLSWLIAARVFQAIGAGALVPISIAIVGDLFPSGRRAIPLGLVGASAEAGGVVGPLWGGMFINYLNLFNKLKHFLYDVLQYNFRMEFRKQNNLLFCFLLITK